MIASSHQPALRGTEQHVACPGRDWRAGGSQVDQLTLRTGEWHGEPVRATEPVGGVFGRSAHAFFGFLVFFFHAVSLIAARCFVNDKNNWEISWDCTFVNDENSYNGIREAEKASNKNHLSGRSLK